MWAYAPGNIIALKFDEMAINGNTMFVIDFRIPENVPVRNDNSLESTHGYFTNFVENALGQNAH